MVCIGLSLLTSYVAVTVMTDWNTGDAGVPLVVSQPQSRHAALYGQLADAVVRYGHTSRSTAEIHVIGSSNARMQGFS